MDPNSSWWVVTGYSSKQEGFLYIVKAETEDRAFERVANLRSWIFRRIVETQGDGDDSATAEIKLPYLFSSEAAYERYQKDTTETGWMPEVRWNCFAVSAQKVEPDTCLRNAVLW